MDLFFIVFILFIFQLAPPPTMCQDDYNAVMTNDHEDSLDTDQNANYDQADLLSELRDNWNYPLRYLQKRGYTGDISEIEEGADANNETVPAPTNSTNAPEAPAEVNTTTVKPSFLGKLKNMWSKIISPGGNLSDSVMLDTPELYEAINEILEVGKNRRSVPFDCSQCTNCSSPIKPGNSSSPAQVQTTTATAVTTTKAPTTTTARTATNNPASAGELKMEDIEFLRKFIQCLQSKQEILKKVEQSKNITTASAAKGTTPKPSKNQSVPTTASKAANSAKTSCATDGSKNTTDPKSKGKKLRRVDLNEVQKLIEEAKETVQITDAALNPKKNECSQSSETDATNFNIFPFSLPGIAGKERSYLQSPYGENFLIGDNERKSSVMQKRDTNSEQLSDSQNEADYAPTNEQNNLDYDNVYEEASKADRSEQIERDSDYIEERAQRRNHKRNRKKKNKDKFKKEVMKSEEDAATGDLKNLMLDINSNLESEESKRNRRRSRARNKYRKKKKSKSSRNALQPLEKSEGPVCHCPGESCCYSNLKVAVEDERNFDDDDDDYDSFYSRRMHKRNVADEDLTKQINAVVSSVGNTLQELETDDANGEMSGKKRKVAKKNKKQKSALVDNENREKETKSSNIAAEPGYISDYNNIKFLVSPEEGSAIDQFIQDVNSPAQVFTFDINQYITQKPIRSIDNNLQPAEDVTSRTFFKFPEEVEEHTSVEKPPGQYIVFNEKYPAKRDILKQRIKAISTKMQHDSLSYYPPAPLLFQRPQDRYLRGEDQTQMQTQRPPPSENDFVDNFYLLNDGQTQIEPQSKKIEVVDPMAINLDLELDKKFRDLKLKVPAKTANQFYN